MSDHEHFGRIARQLTPPRRAVLEALTECGPMTAEQIAECWQRRDPELSPLITRSLPRMVSQSLWKLEYLDMVRISEGLVSITILGSEQLHRQPSSRLSAGA